MRNNLLKIKNLILEKNLKIEKDLKVFHLKNIKKIVNYLNFQVKIGTNVAKINEQNSSDCEKNDGKKSVGKIIPIKIDFEKSGLGNNNNPAIKPIIIEMYEFFSLKDFE
tara:strand:+ start:572 stop:898 length:327 start_codon:yes stop_codon:yes gene_type:complete